jgi:hypothetical protein
MLPARTSGYAKGCSVAANLQPVSLSSAARTSKSPRSSRRCRRCVRRRHFGHVCSVGEPNHPRNELTKESEPLMSAAFCSTPISCALHPKPRATADPRRASAGSPTTTARPSRSRAGAVETLGKLIDESQRLHCGRDPLLFDFSPLASDRICESPQGQRIAL